MVTTREAIDGVSVRNREKPNTNSTHHQYFRRNDPPTRAARGASRRSVSIVCSHTCQLQEH